MNQANSNGATQAFTMASWLALAVGTVGFLVGLWNAEMGIEEKGYYFTVLAFGMYAAVSVQKSVRDRIEGLPVSNIYYGISWAAIVTAVALLAIGLYNATTITLSEKGFYAMAYILCVFAAVTVQKNTRDQSQLPKADLLPPRQIQPEKNVNF